MATGGDNRRALRRHWRGHETAGDDWPPFVPDPRTEAGARRFGCGDVADLTDERAISSEIRCLHGALNVIARRGARLLWHTTNGHPMSDRQWVVRRLQLLGERLADLQVGVHRQLRVR